jgi:hypothetical protein
MSHPIITVELLIELSDNQQEFLVGGADFELNNSNFGQNVVNKQSLTSSGARGNISTTSVLDNLVNGAAESYIGLGSLIPAGITNLSAPILESSPVNSFRGTIAPGAGTINTFITQAPIANALT